jgi:3-oxoacyl-[acyl-carrier protein] reductase
LRRFEGQSVLVTGASRGLGRALAEAFAREGAFVTVHYQARAAEAEKTLALVRAAGGDGVALGIDLRHPEAIAEGLHRLVEERGAPDVLVNNAALLQEGSTATMPVAELSEVVQINLIGLFACCQALARPMIARRRGTIVNIASISALRALPGQVAYAASKAGLLALTRSMALELAPRGVRVNAVVPGLFDAGMGARLDPRSAAALKERIPAGRFGAPSELAGAALFLASEESSYVIGHALVVDGGFSL